MDLSQKAKVPKEYFVVKSPIQKPEDFEEEIYMYESPEDKGGFRKEIQTQKANKKNVKLILS